jgi:hypothetical protein
MTLDFFSFAKFNKNIAHCGILFLIAPLNWDLNINYEICTIGIPWFQTRLQNLISRPCASSQVG